MKNTELFPKSSFLFVLSAFVAEFILKVISIIIIQYSPPLHNAVVVDPSFV